MFSNLVRIIDIEEESCGTGIVIANNRILTSEHVIDDQHTAIVVWNGKKYQTRLVSKNNCIALLDVSDLEFEKQYQACKDRLYFAVEENLDTSTEWCVEGFISDGLEAHTLTGRRIVYKEGIKNIDCVLGPVETGVANNYSGLSGSPIIVNERAIGILQVQKYDPAGNLGLEFSSIQLFSSELPMSSIKESRYIEELRKISSETCLKHIDKNKTSAKYIPDIYVEENNYKDNLRYFTEPLLFINKMVEELKLLDFEVVNQRLLLRNQNTINFQTYPDVIDKDSLKDVISRLEKELEYSILAIKQLEEDKRKKGLSIEEEYMSGRHLYFSVKWDLEDFYQQLKFFKYRMILLTRDAGQGKTNFLCDFTENYLLKKKIVSIYYNAFEFCERPVDTILRKLTCDKKYELQYIKKVLSKRWNLSLQPIIIIIDGLNENTTLNNFGKYMEESLAELMSIPSVKIIMTSRNELLEERFGGLCCETLGATFCSLNMRARGEEFGERIFQGYLSFFNIDIVKDSLWWKTYDLLINDTLLLRFFCEVNKGKRQVYMYDIYMYSLFERYYENKKEEMNSSGILGGAELFERLIEQVCQYMLKEKTFSKIPKSAINSNEIQVLDKMLETDVIFKEDSERKKGFLNEITQVLSFTFDEFRDYCITRYLLSLDDIENRFPVLWERICTEKWSVLEGIQKYIFFLARTKYKPLLMIIRDVQNYEYMYWNNVWALTEEDITEEDVELWKEQFIQEGEYRSQITRYLLRRFDRSYFKKVSIDLLYDILEMISQDLGKYDKLVKLLFGQTEKDKYKQEIIPNGCVYPCDKIVERIKDALDNKDKNFDYYDFLKLTIYVFEILPEKIIKIWEKAYSDERETVIKILEEYIDKKNAPIIEQNILEIIYKLQEKYTARELEQLSIKFNDIPDYKKLDEVLSSIWL